VHVIEQRLALFLPRGQSFFGAQAIDLALDLEPAFLPDGYLLHPKRQGGKATAHVRIPRRKPDLAPVPIGNGFTAAPPVRAGSEAALQRRHRGPRSRRPLALTTSIRPAFGNDPATGSTSGTSSAGTKPPTGEPTSSCHTRASRRHSYNCERDIPCRRAVVAHKPGSE